MYRQFSNFDNFSNTIIYRKRKFQIMDCIQFSCLFNLQSETVPQVFFFYNLGIFGEYRPVIL